MAWPANGRITTLAGAALATLLAGCSNSGFDAYWLLGPHENRVVAADANSVQIQYLGDVETTVPLARQRCAQYAKVPERFSDSSGLVTYLCRDPASAPGQLRGDLNAKLTMMTALLPASRH
jgi:hypothetical protein